MNITERFLKYVSFCTTSDDETNMTPSTPGQMEFAKYLAAELQEIGMQEVTLDDNGYVMATLPANVEGKPTIGFIAIIILDNMRLDILATSIWRSVHMGNKTNSRFALYVGRQCCHHITIVIKCYLLHTDLFEFSS